MLSRRDFLKLLGSAAGSLFLQRYSRQNPTVRRVYLFETHVAGFQYHEGMKPEVAALLTPQTDLVLVREPENEYDEWAIAVCTQAGHHLGYIPRAINEIPATLADQDVLLGAEILEFSPEKPPWQRLYVRVFEVI